jgi:hypothetical protein
MTHPDGNILNLVSSLEFFDFTAPVLKTKPSESELETISSTMGKKLAFAVLEDYFNLSSDSYALCGIRPGSVLRLKDGGYILVGHVSETLGYVDDFPFVNLDDIQAIAYIY